MEEWAKAQGLSYGSTSTSDRVAAWLVFQLEKRHRQPTCVKCGRQSPTCMACQDCQRHFCVTCLELEPDCMFDIEFCCPPCIVSGLQPFGSYDEHELCPYLLRLAMDTLRSSSGHLALSTWRNYTACVREAVEFTGHRGEQVGLSASTAAGFPFVSTTSIYAGSIQLAQLQARRRHPCVLDRHCLGLARTPRRLEFAGGITSLHQRVLHSTTLGDIENVAVAPPSPHLSFLFHAHPFLFSVEFFLLHVHSLHSFTS